MAEALCSADLAKKKFVTFKPMGRNLHRDLPLERTGQQALALRNAAQPAKPILLKSGFFDSYLTMLYEETTTPELPFSQKN